MSFPFKDPSFCSGCRSCENCCPRNAISFKRDNLGFLYPYIDKNECIHCGICTKVCSFSEEIDSHIFSSPQFFYLCASNHPNTLKTSRSGGIFAELAKSILNLGGNVYGAALQKDGLVRHIKITNISDIKLLVGSKYTQSEFSKEIFDSIKQDASKSKLSLICATPCQIAGIKLFLAHNKLNTKRIVFIDLFCHGVMSPKMVKNYIFHGNTVKQDFNFRDKRKGWDKHYESWSKGNGVRFSNLLASNYMSNLFDRDSCYNCLFAQEKRVGDISLGDAWNYQKITGTKYDHGASYVLCNTEKGERLFSEIKPNIKAERITKQHVISNSKALMSPTMMPKKVASARTKLIKNKCQPLKYIQFKHNMYLVYEKLRHLIAAPLKKALNK